MPWRPLPRIAFAVAIYPFQPSSPADLPLELGDELYIIEQGGKDGAWFRGYLVAQPSLLAGLTSVKGQTLEARVFSGIFPRNCVEIREVLGAGGSEGSENGNRSPLNSNGQVVGDSTSYNGTLATPLSGQSLERPVSQIKLTNGDHWSGNGDIDFSTSAPSPSRDPTAPKPAAPVPMLKIGDETPTSLSEPLVDEIASCLREWHSTNLHELLLARKYDIVEKMSWTVSQLDAARRQLLHSILTGKERATLREQVIWRLVEANKLLSGDVIVRDPEQRGRLLTGDDSAIELSKLQATMSALPHKPQQKSDQTSLYHLLFDMKNLAGSTSESMVLNIYLCLKSEDGSLRPLSETYSMELDSVESFSSLAQHNKVKTLFTDVKTADDQNGPRIFLVVKVSASQVPLKVGQPQRPRPSATATREPPGSRQAMKGSLKGRRSMMWGPKARGGTAEVPDLTRPPTQASDYSDNASVKDKDEPKVIRTVGVGVMEIDHILKQSTGVEHAINIWSPAGDSDEEADISSEEHSDILNDVLRSHSGRYKRCRQVTKASVYLHSFTDADAEHLVEKNPTLMHLTPKTRKLGFSEAPTKPRSDIYLTLLETSIPEPRPLLSHPQNGLVQLAQGSDLSNLQLTLEVRDSSGGRIERCIYPSSNSVGYTAWRTTVTQRGVAWNQTIRLDIPTHQVPGAHLIMSVANAPEFPFALSWMPLWDDGAFIRDDSYVLIMHAYDKTTSSMENGRGAYLDLPWSFRGEYHMFRDELVTGPVASITLWTHLCSTEFSQDQVVLGLINWKALLGARVLDLLKRLPTVDTIEIVKQLGAVLDALFGILIDNSGKDEYEDLVFSNLVVVLDTVHDRRFNTGPIIDKYADSHFNFPFASSCLIRSYLRLLLPTRDKAHINKLYAALKVGNYLLKFIVRAHKQQRVKEQSIGITKGASAFSRDIQSIFTALETHMRDQSGDYLKIRTRATQHLHTWLPELLGAFEKQEVVKTAVSFVESCSNVRSLLIQYKIILIYNLTKLDIFCEATTHRQLVLKSIEWLAPYWGSNNNVDTGKEFIQWRDQVRLCASVVAEQLKTPIPELYGYMPKIVASYCTIESMPVVERQDLSLLFPKSIKPPKITFKDASSPQHFEEALIELSAIAAALSRLPDPAPLDLDDAELEAFLFRALDAHTSVLSCVAYPKSWLSLHIYNHRAILGNLEQLSTILVRSFLPPSEDAGNFNTELWRSFFELLLKLVSSDTLALETFPEQKRRAVWKIAGDVREFGAELLRRTWESIGWEADAEDQERFGLQRLGGYQVQYVPSLVLPILELCLSVHEGLRHVAVEVLQTMIISEWALNEDLSMFQAEIITSLDALFKSRRINENATQKVFLVELLDLFEPLADNPEDEFFNAVSELIGVVDELLDLLVAVYSASALTESFNKLKLMNFMRQRNKDDIFIRYVHELARDQAASKNFTEAGLALRFHAELYKWSLTKMVPALSSPNFAQQTAFERKEALYFEMIQHFEDGKAWSHVLASYKELALCYETIAFDYSKLAKTQHSMAKIHDAVVRDDKPSPRYFRVVYKGLGFPTTIREKQFIFEGMPGERIAAFTDRMQKMHPTAQVVANSEDVDDVEGQFLQITSVSPHRELLHPVLRRAKIPTSVRENLLVSSPRQFSITSKRQTTGSNVKEQWVEKTMLKTTEPFPNILKRSEIESVEDIKLTPLQTAVERTWRKTQELLIFQKRSADGDDKGFAALTEVLSQLIDLDSPTATCVAAYREFLRSEDDDEIGSEAEDQEPVEDDESMDDESDVGETKLLEKALKVALIDHALAIKRCLTLYHRPAHQATQAQLTQRFQGAFAPELAIISPTFVEPENVPLPDDSPKPASRTGSRILSPEPKSRNSKHGPAPNESTTNSKQVDGPAPNVNGGHKANRLSLNPFKRATTPLFLEHKVEPEIHISGVNDDDVVPYSPQHTNEKNRSPILLPSVNGSEDDRSQSSRAHGRGDAEKSNARRSFLGAFGMNTNYQNIPAPQYHYSQPTADANGSTQMSTVRTQTEPLPPLSIGTDAESVTSGRGQENDYGYASKTRRPVTSESNRSKSDAYSASGENDKSTSGAPRKTIRKRFSLLRVGKKSSGPMRVSGILEEE